MSLSITTVALYSRRCPYSCCRFAPLNVQYTHPSDRAVRHRNRRMYGIGGHNKGVASYERYA